MVACPVAFGRDDPNAEVYDDAARDAWPAMTRRRAARRCRSCASPRPAGSTDDDGAVAPASHMNFLIANGAVIVPIYDDARRRASRVEALRACSPSAR